MAIKMSQGLKQSQNLAMTPQLQQAIKLLTLTHLEMTNVIAEEMVENPMLEEVGGEVDIDSPPDADMEVREATSDDFSEAPFKARARCLSKRIFIPTTFSFPFNGSTQRM